MMQALVELKGNRAIDGGVLDVAQTLPKLGIHQTHNSPNQPQPRSRRIKRNISALMLNYYALVSC